MDISSSLSQISQEPKNGGNDVLFSFAASNSPTLHRLESKDVGPGHRLLTEPARHLQPFTGKTVTYHNHRPVFRPRRVSRCQGVGAIAVNPYGRSIDLIPLDIRSPWHVIPLKARFSLAPAGISLILNGCSWFSYSEEISGS